jgi:hypothetical protein
VKARARLLWTAALVICVAPSCSIAPAKAEEKFALEFLDLVRHGRIDEAFARLDPTIADANGRSQLEGIARLLGPREPLHVDHVSAGIFTNVNAGVRTASFVLQLEYPSSWYLADLVVRSNGERQTMLGLHVRRLADSLQHQNAFTFRKMTLRHAAIVAAAFIAFAISVTALVVCGRSHVKRKPLWMLISACGVGQLTLNWTTGAVIEKPISVLLLSAGAMRAGQYAPWQVMVAFPLGAVLFLGLRPRLPTRSVESNPPNQEEEERGRSGPGTEEPSKNASDS